MDWWIAIVLGAIQGATEYLPVSSSAHLALAPFLFHWPQPSFAFDVLVQLGTLGAVCVYLRDDIARIVRGTVRGLVERRPLGNEDARRGWMIVVATIPAVVIGLLIKDFVEAAFGDLQEVLVELFVNGLMLAGAELLARRQARSGKARELTFALALGIGFAQALAILPAISRSGATIAGALALGVRRDDAGRFSFLMSIPVLLGAGVLSAKDFVDHPDVLAREGAYLAGAFVVAALVGFFCIKWFLDFVRRHTLYPFAVYCCAVAAIGLVATRLMP